jgi:hypothetical protein
MYMSLQLYFLHDTLCIYNTIFIFVKSIYFIQIARKGCTKMRHSFRTAAENRDAFPIDAIFGSAANMQANSINPLTLFPVYYLL